MGLIMGYGEPMVNLDRRCGESIMELGKLETTVEPWNLSQWWSPADRLPLRGPGEGNQQRMSGGGNSLRSSGSHLDTLVEELWNRNMRQVHLDTPVEELWNMDMRHVHLDTLWNRSTRQLP
ncbi:hypothetical protein XENOCAPTIV_016137 [Xenoophorus captivus]|uniref:Uncharacterized protein n=1 Tax=Xenoophorus captivus TaxID=1517983 RepID=A0ABV0RIV8_9TELE